MTISRRVKLGAVLALQMLALAGCSSGQVAEEPVGQPALDVTVPDLVKAYDDNEALAQQTYGGRLVRLTAIVDSVKLDSDDRPFVNLASENTLLPVQLHFDPASEGEAAGLARGSQYAFECAEVSEMLGSPMLARCRLVG